MMKSITKIAVGALCAAAFLTAVPSWATPDLSKFGRALNKVKKAVDKGSDFVDSVDKGLTGNIGNNQNQGQPQAQDNTNTNTTPNTGADTNAADPYLLSPNGFGPFRVGMPTNLIPQTVDGIYDERAYLQLTDMDDRWGNVYWCLLNGASVMQIFYNDNQPVGEIEVYHPQFHTPNGVYVGMSEIELKTIPGLRGMDNELTEQTEYTGDGFTYITYRAYENESPKVITIRMNAQ